MWELDDLWVYSTLSGEWKLIEQDNTRRKDPRSDSRSNSSGDKSSQRKKKSSKSPRKKNQNLIEITSISLTHLL